MRYTDIAIIGGGLVGVELFGELAAHFHAKVEFPAEATDGVADEQFLRNVVDVIYRTRPEAVLAV